MADKPKHLMLSYQWDSQELVKQIHAALVLNGVNCWLDIAGGMTGNINAAMAEGVEGAGVICCLMTQKYQDSRNCQKELNYADACAIPIVPVMAQPQYKQSGWLGVMTAGALWTDFTRPDKFTDSVQHLLKEIRKACPHVITNAPKGGKKTVEMNTDEICKKLVEGGLDKYIGKIAQLKLTGEALSKIKTGDLNAQLGVEEGDIDKFGGLFGLAQGTDVVVAAAPVDPVFELLKAENVADVKKWLEAGAPVDSKTAGKGETPLIMASRRNDISSLNLLIEKKGNVHAANAQGINALMAAAMSGHTGACKVLLGAGARVNDVASNAAGDSALSLAVYKNHTETAIVLLDAGADVNRVDKDDQDTCILDAAILKNETLVSKLVEKKANVNHQNIDGNTALHNAAKNAAPGVVRVLLEAKADFTLKNKEGKTALQSSAEFECSKALLNKVAQSPSGERSAFLKSSSLSDVRSFLAKYPNDVEVFDDAGDTKLILAARANQPEIVKVLVNEYKASVNNPNIAHSSPLMASAMRGHDEIVEFLIGKGANMNQRTKNLDSPLSLAVWKNQVKSCKLLIDAGANITGIDRYGDSMLHDAAKNGNTELVRHFLSKQMNIDHQSEEGFAPIHRASEYGHPDVVKQLLAAGANVDLRDKKGKTPDEIAKDPESRRLIVAHRAEKQKQQQEAAARAQTAVNSAIAASARVAMPSIAAGGAALAAAPAAFAAAAPAGNADFNALMIRMIASIDAQTAEISKLRTAVEKIASVYR